MDYHQRAQSFIKGAKKKGMAVKAEGGELIAYPKQSKADKAFHDAAGTHKAGTYYNGVPSPAKLLKDTIVGGAKNLIVGTKRNVKKAITKGIVRGLGNTAAGNKVREGLRAQGKVY